MDAGTFFNRLALAMKDNPPYADESRMIEKLKKLGIEPGKPLRHRQGGSGDSGRPEQGGQGSADQDGRRRSPR